MVIFSYRMKRLFIFLLFFCFAQHSFAQSDFRFADSTAQWNVLSVQVCMTQPCIFFETKQYTVIGNAVLNNYQYQNINADGINNYVRKDSTGKVFIRNAFINGEELLYDFSLVAGDTLNYDSQRKCRINNVDTVILDRPRKRMFVSFIGWHDDVFIEGIGAVYTNFLTPGVNVEEVDGPDEKLLCFYETNNLVFHDSLYPVYGSWGDTLTFPCIIDSSWVGIDEGNIDSGLKIYPNPASQMINIQTDNVQSSIKGVSVYDVTGKAMHGSTSLTMTNATVDVSNLPNGLYFLHVEMSNGQRVVRKMVKE